MYGQFIMDNTNKANTEQETRRTREYRQNSKRNGHAKCKKRRGSVDNDEIEASKERASTDKNEEKNKNTVVLFVLRRDSARASRSASRPYFVLLVMVNKVCIAVEAHYYALSLRFRLYARRPNSLK